MDKARTRGSALLALLLSAAVAFVLTLVPLQSAYAVDDNCTYSVSTTSASSIYVDAFQLFEGDVDDTTDAISNVSWGGFQNEVLAFLGQPIATTGASTTYGTWLYNKGLSTTNLTNVSLGSMTATNRAAYESAENALAYIVEEINASSGAASSSSGRITGPGSFSNLLADYLHANATPPTATGSSMSGAPANFSALHEGFYLFYSYDATDTYNPIWTPVGGSVTSATVKNQDVLSIEKKIWDAESNSWGKITDSRSGEKVTFRVSGTLPKNEPDVAYMYTLEDTLSSGLTIYTTNNGGVMLPEVRVYAVDNSASPANEVDITDLFAASQSGNTLTIAAIDDDLWDKGNNGHNATAIAELANADHIVFEYSATLNVAAADFEGTTYSENKAKLKYGTPTDPFETTEDTAYVATYELIVKKVDSDTGADLDGAKFTISTQYTDPDTGATSTKYVQSDGTLADTPYEFESGNGYYPHDNTKVWDPGMISAPIIDAGTYVVEETQPPIGHKLPALTSTTVVITATKDVPNGAVTALTATANNNATVTATLGTGIVEVEIENDPSTVLPVTGMTPNQLGTVIGIVLVALGMVALIVRNVRKSRANA